MQPKKENINKEKNIIVFIINSNTIISKILCKNNKQVYNINVL